MRTPEPCVTALPLPEGAIRKIISQLDVMVVERIYTKTNRCRSCRTHDTTSFVRSKICFSNNLNFVFSSSSLNKGTKLRGDSSYEAQLYEVRTPNQCIISSAIFSFIYLG